MLGINSADLKDKFLLSSFVATDSENTFMT